MAEVDNFSPHVASELKTYVYRLIDPRTGETFYVGKGRGNRVFAHIRDELKDEGDQLGDKLSRIREIRLAGLSVGHVIHRHGMDDSVAFEVEAALIDAYPGLSNVAGGMGSDEFGVMHAREIVERYEAPEAVFHHRTILISINKTAAERSVYDATRYAWRINVRRASQAEIVLSTVQGLIIGAFEVEKWLPATSENFPGLESAPGRFGFVGREAPQEIKRQYLRRRIPDRLRKQGAANPIKYTWK